MAASLGAMVWYERLRSGYICQKLLEKKLFNMLFIPSSFNWEKNIDKIVYIRQKKIIRRNIPFLM